MKIGIKYGAASLCLLLALGAVRVSPVAAQGDGFKALQNMLTGMSKKPAAPAPAPMSSSGMDSIAKAKAALKGKWEAHIKSCYQSSDSYIWAQDGSWSGYEFSCTVPAKAYTPQGFSGALACSAEGNDYTSSTQVILAADGKSAKVTDLENGTVQTLFKCPKETESIMP